MFDNVQCEYPLPDGLDPTGIDFQTKSMDSVLDTYVITEHGRLCIYPWSIAYSTKKERQPQWLAHTGNMNFYTSVDQMWHEYRATFVDGLLTKIETSTRWER